MKEPKANIGLLGGSFDPVHNGHISIAQSFLKSGYISELWILPAPDPPHKTHALSDFNIRVEMLQAAFGERPDVRINEIEKQLSYPSYTVQTVKYLVEETPEVNFYLCVGEDSAMNFKEWFDWQVILDYCDLLIARRPDLNDYNLDKQVAQKSHFVSHQPIGLSSTTIRASAMRGKDISNMVPPGVKHIIESRNLYT